MHICVYAICKDESKFVDRFMDSVNEADSVVVLDTGSTDNTVELLKARGATVAVKEITPWRFDVARNESMKLIPEDADVCVCVDLDETFDPGWAEGIRKHWKPGYTEKARYAYAWNHDEHGKPKTVIWYEKIHDNTGNFGWAMPIHEALTYKPGGNPNTIIIPESDLYLHHYPDPFKSRGQYLDLLRMATAERPDGYMEHYYLGRELTYYKKWEEAVEVLTKVVNMPTTLKPNQAAAYGFLGKSYEELGNLIEAEKAYIHGANIVDNVREPMVKLMEFYYRQQRWYSLMDVGERVLQVPYVPTEWYEDINNYGYIPLDYMSIACWHIGLIEKGRQYLEQAIQHNPDLERLQTNLPWFKVD